MASCAGVIWSILWFILLFVAGWPVGGICAMLYLFFSPFSACIEPCTAFVELLEKGFKLPLTCALNMVHSKPIC